jgi:ADP-ribosylglycohydrolase/fructose-1,6-bisphosphatase/inositol monophosphatase family enzyme
MTEQPFRPNPIGGPPPDESNLWLRPNRNLDSVSVESYALTFDGYRFSEMEGFDLGEFANRRRDEFVSTGGWQGSFQDLRYCLFFEQRRRRHVYQGQPPKAIDELVLFSLNQAVCDAWEREQGCEFDIPKYSRELQHAIAAAQAAGEMLREYFHRGEAQKADRSADERIYAILSRAFPHFGYLGEEVGLDSTPRDVDRHLWLVDPQDGTNAAGKGFRGAAVSIALLRSGKPVLGVVYAYSAPDSAGDLFFWAEGMRSIGRNNDRIARTWPDKPDSGCTALISQDADRKAEANAAILYPMRYRAVPGIAYRLALAAAGEGDLAVSLNWPTGWDIAGGHALLIGAGGDVFDRNGEPVTYDLTGKPEGSDLSMCFGGTPTIVSQYRERPWKPLLGSSAASAAKSLSFLTPGNVVADPNLLDRAHGCLLGQLAGDALGSLVEFSGPEEIRKRYPSGPLNLEEGGYWNTIAGQPTDDSELALALARSILKCGGYDHEGAAAAYASWKASGPFDCGGTTATALGAAVVAMKNGKPVAQAAMQAANGNSQANGALMRINPLAIFGHTMNAAALMEMARQDARLTHPNRVCQDANAIFAATVARAIQSGLDPQDTYEYALSLTSNNGLSPAVAERLHAAATSPPPEFTNSKSGWVLVAFQNAFFQLLHAPSPEQGLVDTVCAGGDTDTNAAIAGALLGAAHGRQNLPKRWIGESWRAGRFMVWHTSTGPGLLNTGPWTRYLWQRIFCSLAGPPHEHQQRQIDIQAALLRRAPGRDGCLSLRRHHGKDGAGGHSGGLRESGGPRGRIVRRKELCLGKPVGDERRGWGI